MDYQEVYFFISSAYINDSGWPSEKEKKAFHEEAVDLFTADGWELCPKTMSAASDTIKKGLQQLYLHPMQFSGLVLSGEISAIEDILKNARTFQYNSTAVYGVYQEMDDETYMDYLHAHKEDLIKAILREYRTKSDKGKKLYVISPVLERICEGIMFKRVSDWGKSGNMAYQYANSLIKELLADGRLITAQTASGPGIRSATVREMADIRRRSISRDKLEQAIESTYDDTRFLVSICMDPDGDFFKGPHRYKSTYYSKAQMLDEIHSSALAEFKTMPDYDENIVINPHLCVWKQSINKSQILPDCLDVEGFHHVTDKTNPHYDVYFQIDHKAKMITFACGDRRKTVPIQEYTDWCWKPTTQGILCGTSEYLERDFLGDMWNPIAVNIGRKVLNMKPVL